MTDTDKMGERILKFVRHHEVADHESQGWQKTGALVHTHHGDWSELMELNSEAIKERQANGGPGWRPKDTSHE